MHRYKKALGVCAVPALLLLAAALFGIFYPNDARHAGKAFQQELGYSLPAGSRLETVMDSHGSFGEGASVYVWRLQNEQIAALLERGADKWKALPLPAGYRNTLNELNPVFFDGKLDCAASLGRYTLRTAGVPWPEGENFPGEHFVLCILDQENGKLTMAKLDK